MSESICYGCKHLFIDEVWDGEDYVEECFCSADNDDRLCLLPDECDDFEAYTPKVIRKTQEQIEREEAQRQVDAIALNALLRMLRGATT